MRVDLQHNRFVYNILVGAAYFVRQPDNVISDLREVSELSSGDLVWEHSVWLHIFVHVVET